MKIKDVSGKRFWRLIALRPTEKRAKGGIVVWECRCDCGQLTYPDLRSLQDGRWKSCGCLRSEKTAASCRLRATHSASKTAEYRSWRGAKQRCTNPNNPRYSRYGGRGITMCDRWRDSFATFLADMGTRPEGKSLDRYPDPDGNYEPANCRWATSDEQCHNLGSNITSHNALKTHCKRGHPFTGRNLSFQHSETGVMRKCVACNYMSKGLTPAWNVETG